MARELAEARVWSSTDAQICDLRRSGPAIVGKKQSSNRAATADLCFLFLFLPYRS